jgi:hypothetical protein
VVVVCNKVGITVAGPGQLTVNWNGNGVLQFADDPAGPWNDLPNARPPFRLDTKEAPARFFRVKL